MLAHRSFFRSGVESFVLHVLHPLPDRDPSTLALVRRPCMRSGRQRIEVICTWPALTLFVAPKADHEGSATILRDPIVGNVYDVGEQIVTRQSVAQVVDDLSSRTAVTHFERQYGPDVLCDYDARTKARRRRNELQDQLVHLFLRYGLVHAASAPTRIRRTHALARRRGYQKIEWPVRRGAIGALNLFMRSPNVPSNPARLRKISLSDGSPILVVLDLHSQPEAGQLVSHVAQTCAGEQGYRGQFRTILPRARLLKKGLQLLETHVTASLRSRPQRASTPAARRFRPSDPGA